MPKSREELLRDYRFAVANVRLKRHELKAARLRAMEIGRELRGTAPTVVIDGKVIDVEETTERKEQEAITQVAPSAQPGQTIPRSD